MLALPKLANLVGHKQFRIIPSVFPTINFFENLVDPSEMAVLWEIEALTNDRILAEIGDIFLVAEADRISGPGASIVMAAFTHIHRSSRFSDGSFGVYYASLSQETAIRETVYHRERFLRTTQEAAGEITMRMYAGEICQPLHDIRAKQFADLHHPSDYTASQQFALALRSTGAWGIIYASVRHPGGHCLAALRPPAVSVPKQIAHLRYCWNGEKITEVFTVQPTLSPL